MHACAHTQTHAHTRTHAYTKKHCCSTKGAYFWLQNNIYFEMVSLYLDCLQDCLQSQTLHWRALTCGQVSVTFPVVTCHHDETVLYQLGELTVESS